MKIFKDFSCFFLLILEDDISVPGLKRALSYYNITCALNRRKYSGWFKIQKLLSLAKQNDSPLNFLVGLINWSRYSKFQRKKYFKIISCNKIIRFAGGV